MSHFFVVIVYLFLFLPFSCATKEAYIEHEYAVDINGRNSRMLEDNTINTKLREVLFYNSRGLAYNDIGQHDMAIEDFNKALTLKPDYALLYSNRGLAYNGKGLYNRAIEDYNKAILIDPKFALAYNNRGFAYHRKGQYDRAIEDYNRAITLTPNDAMLYNNRGGAYYGKEKYDSAIEDYNRAISLKPDYARAHKNRGLAYAAIGKFTKAEEDVRKAIELRPDSTSIIIGMAELLAIKNNAVDACEWLGKSIKKGYKDWNYIKNSKTFENIRGHSCYKELLQK